jgi:hypothetical protein
MKKTLIIITLTLCSCGMFKQSSRTSSQELAEERTDVAQQFSVQTEITKNITMGYDKKDTLDNDYHYILYPKDNFNIDPDGRMTGKLDSLIMKGRIAKTSHSKGLTVLQERVVKSEALVNNKSKTSLSKKKSVEEFKKPDSKLLIITLVLSILIIFWIMRRK